MLHKHTHAYIHTHRPIHWLRECTDRKSFLVLCSFPVSHQIKPAPNLILNSSGSHLPSSPLHISLLLLAHSNGSNKERKKAQIIQVRFLPTKSRVKTKHPCTCTHTHKSSKNCIQKKLGFIFYLVLFSHSCNSAFSICSVNFLTSGFLLQTSLPICLSLTPISPTCCERL